MGLGGFMSFLPRGCLGQQMLEFREARKYYASPGEPIRAVDDVTLDVSARELDEHEAL